MAASRILNFESPIMAAAVAATLVSARLLPFVIGVGLAFWVLRWLSYRRLSLRTPADWRRWLEQWQPGAAAPQEK